MMKKAPNRPVLMIGLLAFAAACFALGLWVGRQTQPSPVAVGDGELRGLSPVASPDDRAEPREVELGATLVEAGPGPASAEIVSEEAFPPSVAELLDRANGELDDLARMQWFTEALRQLNPSNVEQITAFLESMPVGPARMQYLSLLMSAWGRFDAPGAVAYAERATSGRGSRFLAGNALRSWARSDPAAALLWIDESRAENEGRGGRWGNISDLYRNAALMGWAETNPLAATDFLRANWGEGGRSANRTLAAVMGQYLSDSTSEALTYAQNLPEGAFRDQAIAATASHIAASDPEAAARYLQTSGGSPQAAREVFSRWAMESPEASSRFLQTLPDGEQKKQALTGLVTVWSREDPVATGEYLNTIPPGSDRDPAVSRYAQEIVREDPFSAVNWAMTISDDTLRIQSVADTVTRWSREDAEGARQWALDQGLTEAEYQSLLGQTTDWSPPGG